MCIVNLCFSPQVVLLFCGHLYCKDVQVTGACGRGMLVHCAVV